MNGTLETLGALGGILFLVLIVLYLLRWVLVDILARPRYNKPGEDSPRRDKR